MEQLFLLLLGWLCFWEEDFFAKDWVPPIPEKLSQAEMGSHLFFTSRGRGFFPGLGKVFKSKKRVFG